MSTKIPEEELALQAIQAHIHSVVLNEAKNAVEFVLDYCKLISIQYDPSCCKLQLAIPADLQTKTKTTQQSKDASSVISPSHDVDKENMLSKLTMVKESQNDSKDDENSNDEDDGTENKAATDDQKESTNESKDSKPSSKKKSALKTKPKPKKKAEPKKEATSSSGSGSGAAKRSSKTASSKQTKQSKQSKPIESMMKNGDPSSGGSARKRNRKHLRQRSKTTDDIDAFSIAAHEKWQYYSYELTAQQQLRCQGFADNKCRYKMAKEMEFPWSLKREDMIEFKVPLESQRIYGYCVEDCIADGTNGEIMKVQGGTGKKFVRLFVKAQLNHGVHIKLHVWYK